jgi:hypothetical protein
VIHCSWQAKETNRLTVKHHASKLQAVPVYTLVSLDKINDRWIRRLDVADGMWDKEDVCSPYVLGLTRTNSCFSNTTNFVSYSIRICMTPVQGKLIAAGHSLVRVLSQEDVGRIVSPCAHCLISCARHVDPCLSLVPSTCRRCLTINRRYITSKLLHCAHSCHNQKRVLGGMNFSLPAEGTHAMHVTS